MIRYRCPNCFGVLYEFRVRKEGKKSYVEHWLNGQRLTPDLGMLTPKEVISRLNSKCPLCKAKLKYLVKELV